MTLDDLEGLITRRCTEKLIQNFCSKERPIAYMDEKIVLTRILNKWSRCRMN
jgi:hypothetical protein